MSKNKIVFVSTMSGWPASEELWWRTAVNLAKQGFSVSASVLQSSPPHRREQDLKAAGIHVQLRPQHYTLWRRGWHRLFYKNKAKIVVEVDKLLRCAPPKLVVFSEPGPYPPIDLLELCISKNLPYVTIANGHAESYWPEDELAKRYRGAFAAARRCYFVSKANVRFSETQIGCELPNAEVVWSQYNVDFDFSPAWPPLTLDDELRLACVGRLYPFHKGQDILLEALAAPIWAKRPWHLSLYGDGPMRNSLERFTTRLGLSNRVTFDGYKAIKEIWSTNHVLVMPSRCEGMPLALVEAMLCGRPVLATDVAGNSEVIVDGKTGFLAEAPTVAAVTQALERLWASRKNLENMGRAGAKRIRELVPSDPIQVFSEKLKILIQ